MRLDSVEIKLTLAGDEVDLAVQALHLPPDQPVWQIHFCEDVTEAIGTTTPLLDLGVVLRARRRPGERDDTTVKLRPCRGSGCPRKTSFSLFARRRRRRARKKKIRGHP